MTGIEVPGTAALIKMGVAVIQRAAPSGIALIKSWIKGKEILVLGQGRAGKTTFIDYLHYGLFEHEKSVDKTKDPTATPRFNVKLGRDASLELVVKTVFDYPGQWGPAKHADLAFEHRPHVIIILSDATSPIEGDPEKASGAWLKEFCRRLETQWRAHRKKKNRVRALVVAINKMDKVDQKKIARCRKRFLEITDAELRDARGEMKEDVALMPCILVTNSEGTKYVDSIIAHVAKLLAR